MDIEQPIINKAVKELLDKLVREHEGYRWESMCSFSDGKGTTYIEVNVYREKGSERLGRIAYHLETGQVLNFRYNGYGDKGPESIVDLLLDITNLERSRNGKSRPPA